jgi:5-methylcytosine-specific restriction endonuclease McrA
MPHAPKRLRLKPSTAPSVTKRRENIAYGTQWIYLSRRMLREHPVCHCDAVRVWTPRGERIVAFAKPGTIRPAALTDHVQPVLDGGKIFDEANLQTLCRECHGFKTARYG